MANRPITITVQNDTYEKLQDVQQTKEHGTWGQNPSNIEPGSSTWFEAEESTLSLTGPKGTVTWRGASSGLKYSISFNHPYGKDPTVVTPSTEGDYSWKIVNDQLQHHEASCTVDFYKENPGPAIRRRRNQKDLSPSERSRFVRALKTLKANGVYDEFVQLHMLTLTYAVPQGADWAHSTPAFLPWHRAFLNQFELALQSVDSTVTLPYWDWTADFDTNPKKNPLFADDFMGSAGDPANNWKVGSGPFTPENGWILIYNTYQPTPIPGDKLREHYTGPATTEAATYLQRTFGQETTSTTLPTAAQVEVVTGLTPYDVPPYTDDKTVVSFRNSLEGWGVDKSPVWNIDTDGRHMHNRVHMWVGGSMATNGTSPNDPLFFLHHAFIDLLWDRWSRRQAAAKDLYLPEGKGALPALGRDAYMPPWDGAQYSFRSALPHAAPVNMLFTPGDMLSTKELGYVYDESPSEN